MQRKTSPAQPCLASIDGNTEHGRRKADKDRTARRHAASPLPTGGVKITAALRELLTEKEFSAVTFDDIVRTSGVSAALIYRYFGGKRGLLHQLLSDMMDGYLADLERDLKGIKGALNKLRKLIFTQIDLYETNRVLARILLLEVRNHRGYFDSDAYQKIRRYTSIITEVIEEGVRSGEIRNDIPVTSIRQVIVGAFEHLSLPGVIYGKPFSPDDLTEDLCAIVFGGIAAQT